MAQKLEWMVKGDCVEGCTSPPVCPAYWNSPTQAQLHDGKSQCEGVWTFNIREGYYKDIDLKGLKAAYGFNAPSPFPGPKGSPWRTIVYIDKKANGAQAKALEEIFTTCFKVMGEVLKVKKADIEFAMSVEDGGAARHQVKIDGIYSFATRPYRTVDKKPRYVNSFFGGHINIGISEINEFNDSDLPRSKWNAPGMSVSYYDFVLTPEKHHWLP